MLKDLILDCGSIPDAHKVQAQTLGLDITDMHKQHGFRLPERKQKAKLRLNFEHKTHFIFKLDSSQRPTTRCIWRGKNNIK